MRTPDPSRHLPTPTQPLRPSGLDPYPERPSAVAGVRKTADIIHLPTQTPEIDVWAEEPFVVTASLKPKQLQTGRWPVASILIASAAQVLLGVAMATHYVPTILALIIAGGILVCSLLLITAQMICQAVGRDQVY